ncbi:MAG: hypothetical protein K8I29_10295 [Alphaproteobacteria bacterium]|uniref:Uncharacterized protein n=1 Tax=Candidatus Nitrobium versatile TaxID=2884831 RepID=A0A953JD96_9BACT|nr:hypothetical protein [Candidatus Nitrobium versatile]
MDRNFFEGYADRINVNEFFDALSGAENTINLTPLLRSTVKTYVEEGTLIIKEFELDLYKMEDARYVVHICRREGSDNYCDYYIFDEIHPPLKYRILRALIGESFEAHDVHYECLEHAAELSDLCEVLQQAKRLASSRGEK